MTEAEILAWHRTEEGIRWSAIGKALARDDYGWAFRILCEFSPPATALIVLGALVETMR